jgi:hypothetical protein
MKLWGVAKTLGTSSSNSRVRANVVEGLLFINEPRTLVPFHIFCLQPNLETNAPDLALWAKIIGTE